MDINPFFKSLMLRQYVCPCCKFQAFYDKYPYTCVHCGQGWKNLVPQAHWDKYIEPKDCLSESNGIKFMTVVPPELPKVLKLIKRWFGTDMPKRIKTS